MLRYFTALEYMVFLALYLFIVVGQNICWYSLISLLQLISDFSIGGTERNIRFYEDAMVYTYGILLGSMIYTFGFARFNLHSAKLGNKAKSGVLALLYKKVSYMLGVSKKVYGWKLFPKLMMAQNSRKRSVSLGNLAPSGTYRNKFI